MACTIVRVPLAAGGEIVPAEYEADDLAEAARHEPDNGVYASFATWHGLRVPRLSAHFDRLESSARHAGFTLSLDRALLRARLRLLIERSGYGEARVRLTAVPDRAWLLVSFERFSGPPKELRATGVHCRTAPHSAREIPQAKRTAWLTSRPSGSSAGDVYEHLLIDDDGRILEGSKSNFFAVTGDRDAPKLITAGTGVLEGISRSIVLEVAHVEVKFLRIPVASLGEIDEAFVTSSSKGIVPVVQIDEVRIGDGRPGGVTSELIRRYDARAVELEEPL